MDLTVDVLRITRHADDLSRPFKPALDTDALADRICVRPEFLRQGFGHDYDSRPRTPLLFGKFSTAHDRTAHRVEIIRPYLIIPHVPGSVGDVFSSYANWA